MIFKKNAFSIYLIIYIVWRFSPNSFGASTEYVREGDRTNTGGNDTYIKYRFKIPHLLGLFKEDYTCIFAPNKEEYEESICIATWRMLYELRTSRRD